MTLLRRILQSFPAAEQRNFNLSVVGFCFQVAAVLFERRVKSQVWSSWIEMLYVTSHYLTGCVRDVGRVERWRKQRDPAVHRVVGQLARQEPWGKPLCFPPRLANNAGKPTLLVVTTLRPHRRPLSGWYFRNLCSDFIFALAQCILSLALTSCCELDKTLKWLQRKSSASSQTRYSLAAR